VAAPLLQACGGGSAGASAFAAASAQAAPDPESVRWCRETIQATLSRSDIATTAVSVALLADDRVVWREAFGHANRETGLLATPDIRFGIGSVAKVVTTLAVMILRDRGRLSLDQPVVELLPSFSMRSPGFTRITVRQLQLYWTDEPVAEWLAPLAQPLPPAWQARLGSAWRCSNESPDSVASRLYPALGRIDELADLPGYILWNNEQMLRVLDDQKPP
jgi:hypothetical protein